MMKLPSFARARAKLTTLADVQAEHERHAALLDDARASMARLEAERGEVLLGDDTAAIAAHEAKLGAARLNVDRLTARIEALGVQARAIESAEVDAALTARRKAAAARGEAAEQWLRDAYPDLARHIVEGFTELLAAEREIAGVNRGLAEVARDGEALPRVEARVNPGPSGPGAPMPLSLLENTRLMQMPEIGAPGWGKPLGFPRW